MEKVYRAYVNDEISVKTYGAQYRPLEERHSQLDEEIPRLQGEIDFLKIEYLSSDEVLAEARDLTRRWSDLEFEEKRKIVENVVEQITVGENEIEIELAHLPTSEPPPRLPAAPLDGPDDSPSSPKTVCKGQRNSTHALPFAQTRRAVAV